MISSYTEAVLSCQGFPNRFCCAVCALEAHKPELWNKQNQSTMLVPGILVLVKYEKIALQ